MWYVCEREKEREMKSTSSYSDTHRFDPISLLKNGPVTMVCAAQPLKGMTK